MIWEIKKNEIKQEYLKYQNGEISLIEFAKLFHVSISKAREASCVLKIYDINFSDIEIIDKEKEITYKARYTAKPSVVKRQASGNYIEVAITKNASVAIYDYEIKTGMLVGLMGKFYNDSYFLAVVRDEYLGTTTLSYGVIISHLYVNEEQPLLTKIIRNSDSGIYERNYTNSINNVCKFGKNDDRYFCSLENNYVYGIHEATLGDNCLYGGVCFLNRPNRSQFKKYRSISVGDFKELFSNDVQAGMIFRVREYPSNCIVKIVKHEKETTIDIVDYKTDVFNQSSSVSTSYKLPTNFEGGFKREELKALASCLPCLDARLGVISREIDIFLKTLERGALESFTFMNKLASKKCSNILYYTERYKDKYFKFMKEEYEKRAEVLLDSAREEKVKMLSRIDFI